MSLTLTYFDCRGFGDPIRMIMSYGGLEWNDIRIPYPGALPKEIKDQCTWGQVPVLEFEGKKLCQSLAITRYFAKKFNLVGSNDFEAAQCDEYVDTSREIMMNLWYPVLLEEDHEKRGKRIEEATKICDEKYLNKLNSIVENNGGRRLVGNNLTWADIYLAYVINDTELGDDRIQLLKRHPALNSLSQAVLNDEPKIKEWIEKRPKTKW